MYTRWDLCEHGKLQRVNVKEPAGFLLLGNGKNITGPKTIENRTKKLETKRNKGTLRWVLLVSSRSTASAKEFERAQQLLDLHNKTVENPQLTRIPERKTFPNLGAAIGFVLVRDARPSDEVLSNI